MILEQNLRHRAVEEHRKRSAQIVARHALDNGEVDEVIRELVARAATTTTAKPKDTTTTAAVKITPITPPKVATTTPAKATTTSASAKVTGSSSSSTTSAASATSVASTTSVSSTSSVISTSSLTSSTPSITLLPSTTLDRALLPSTSVSHLPSSTSSSSKGDGGAESSSGIRTTTLIGVIAGALGAVLVISIIASFFLRRLRTKRKGGAEVFDAAEFRRSAVLLEKDDQKPDFRPRPPTMIERHVKGAPTTNGNHNSNSNVPPMPTMAYGHHQGSYPQYGNINTPPPAPGAMYNGVPVVPPPGPYGAHYDQAGYGAPPVPGTYAPGAYAPYGPDPRFQQQQHQQQQQQRYPQYSSYQHPGQLYPGGGGPGGMYAPLPQHPHHQQQHGQMDSFGALPNPFARSPAPSTAPPSPIADRHAQQSLHLASSSSSPNGDEDEAESSSAPPPAYVDETGEGGRYRDVKMKPVQLSPPAAASTAAAGTGSTSTSGSAAAAASASAKRMSAYSMYDQDDVYGGI